MLRVRGRGLMVWIALLCSLLLPLTALGEKPGLQPEAAGCAISCNMPDCQCDCCHRTSSNLRGCNCSGGSTPYLSAYGTIILNWQATPHCLESITPVFKAFIANIFHPPKIARLSV